MKSVTRSKPAKGEPMEERFRRFATALMAVPKKELDKELAKDERRKDSKRKKQTNER
jgi:hypothetical protein